MKAEIFTDNNMDPDIFATVDMEITPEMERLMKSEWGLEVEMLQGFQSVLPNGMVHYILVIRDAYKADLLREVTLKCISRSHEHALN